MIKITNGINVYEVTRGAFESIFKKQGYHEIVTKDKKQSVNDDGGKSKTEEELFVEEIVEIPIAQWTKEDVKRFASIKGIDISNTKNVTEAKNIIMAHIS